MLLHFHSARLVSLRKALKKHRFARYEIQNTRASLPRSQLCCATGARVSENDRARSSQKKILKKFEPVLIKRRARLRTQSSFLKRECQCSSADDKVKDNVRFLRRSLVVHSSVPPFIWIIESSQYL